MSATTYGSDSLRALTTNRVTSLQRPFQLFILTGDFLLILFSDMAAGALYRCLMGSAADQENSVGAGLLVGVVFVLVAYFQGVYDNHRLLNAAWQARKVVVIWLSSLMTLAVVAFLLKSTDNLSRGEIILFAVTGIVGLTMHRVFWRYCLASAFAKSRLVDRKVILVSLRALDLTSCGTMALMSYVISSSTRATSTTTQPGVAKFAASSGNRVRPAWT